MIRLLKNKEVRSALILQLVLSLAAVTAIFFINKTACIITALLSLLLITVYLLTTYARYKKLSALAADINKLLHTDRPLALESYCEGELGIDPYWTSEAIGNILKNCMEHTSRGCFWYN